MFLPTTLDEAQQRGWKKLEVIIVTGDSYIDSPYIGAAVIGRFLEHSGFRVGIIAQPDLNSPTDISRLGEPELFWGVRAGSVNSMVANYTPILKPRRNDDYTPGGENTRRPDRATIVYTNLIKRYFNNTKPIALGGIEASLRRIAHYDYWSNKIRRSILFDAKADILVYGMAEKTSLLLAAGLKKQKDLTSIPGICYISKSFPQGYLQLPSFEKVAADKDAFIEMFHLFYANRDPLTAHGLYQAHGNRYLIHNPPQATLSQAELDNVYELDYENELHPLAQERGSVRALETIQFSLCSHRGCYGECNFCAVSVHQGTTIQWRSEHSLIREAKRYTKHGAFKGIIRDVGGPTANMYASECPRKLKLGHCQQKRCLYPAACPELIINHHKLMKLLTKVKAISGINKVFVASAIRPDLLLADQQHGPRFLTQLLRDHTSGQLKVAPEHSELSILRRMGKPSVEKFLAFKKLFEQFSTSKQFLTYYFLAAHPGTREQDMRKLRIFTRQKLKLIPRQVQVFTPTPSTYSSCMYWTEKDPFTGERLFVEKNLRKKEFQKKIIVPGEQD